MILTSMLIFVVFLWYGKYYCFMGKSFETAVETIKSPVFDQNRFVDFQAFTRQSVVPKITPVRIIVVELASHFNKGYSPTIEV
jgi:hypothetical protein